jgi:hypothetical protein
LGAVVEVEQGDHAEDDVAIGAGVGDDHLGPAAGVLAVDQIDHVQRVPAGARQDPAGEPDALIGDHVQPRRATPPPEVLGVRAGVDAADRDDEPHPVDPGDEAAAPPWGEIDAVLSGDQRCVRERVVLRAQIVLIDVTDPPASQRRDAVGDHRDVPDVQRVRGQRVGDREIEIAHPAPPAGQASERCGERGQPAHHLKDQLREIDPGEHRLQPTAQINKARRVRDRVDLLGVEPPVRADVRDGPGGQALRHPPPRAVKRGGVLAQQLAGILRQAERVQRRALRGLPRPAGEQLRARVPVPCRRGGVDVAAD